MLCKINNKPLNQPEKIYNASTINKPMITNNTDTNNTFPINKEQKSNNNTLVVNTFIFLVNLYNYTYKHCV